VVVKFLDAVIADVAMSSPLRPPDEASLAEFEPEDRVLVELEKHAPVFFLEDAQVFLVYLAPEIAFKDLLYTNTLNKEVEDKLLWLE